MDLYASNLKICKYLVIFQGSFYITVDLVERIVSETFFLPSSTMAFFRNFGDQLVLVSSSYHKGESIIPFNLHKFDPSSGEIVGFREKIFSNDGRGEYR
jgi:hypothetical protein